MDQTDKPGDSANDAPEPNTPPLAPPAELQEQWLVVGTQDNECGVITTRDAEKSPTRYKILFGPTNDRAKALHALVLATKGGLPKGSYGYVGGKYRHLFHVNVKDRGPEQLRLPAPYEIENTDPDYGERGEMVPLVHSRLPSIEEIGLSIPGKLPPGSCMPLSSGHTPTLPPIRNLLQETALYGFSHSYPVLSLGSYGRSPTTLSVRQEQSERSFEPQDISGDTEIAENNESEQEEQEYPWTREEPWEYIRAGRPPPGPSRLRKEVAVSSTESDRLSKSSKRSVEDPCGLSDDSQEEAKTKKGYWDVVL